MLPRRPRVDLGAMAMKGWSVFPKASALLEPPLLSVISRIRIAGELNPLQRCSQSKLNSFQHNKWLNDYILPKSFCHSGSQWTCEYWQWTDDFPQRYRTKVSPWKSLISYPGHSLGWKNAIGVFYSTERLWVISLTFVVSVK